MLTREQKIDAIYEKIANKDLDFWCIVESKWGQSVFLADRNRREIFRTNYRIVDFIRQEEPMKIIGHPVMIGDVMDFFEEHSETDKGTITQWDGVKTIKMWCTKEKKIEILNYNLFLVWKKKRNPIEKQSNECIEFIYNLLTN